MQFSHVALRAGVSGQGRSWYLSAICSSSISASSGNVAQLSSKATVREAQEVKCPWSTASTGARSLVTVWQMVVCS